jgi:hypothetical protein
MLLGPLPSPSLKTDSTTDSSVAVVSRPVYRVSFRTSIIRTASQHTCHSHPVVDHHARTHDRTTAIHTARHKRHLQQTRQLVLILNARLGMHNTTLITQRHVASRQHIIRNRLPEDLDAQRIRYYLLRLALDVRVYERDVVVAAYYVSERGQALFYPLDLDAVWYRVAQVLELLVGRGGRDEKAALVAGGQAADYSRTGDCGVADGNDVLEFGFEDTVGGLVWWWWMGCGGMLGECAPVEVL